MKTFKESAMRVRQGDVKPTAKIMVTQHIEKGNFKKTLDLLKHIGKKVKVDKSTEKTSKAIWTIEGTMNESAMDQKMFDSLKKGDKLSVSFGSGIRKDNKVTLLVKSKSKSAKYNLEKINCVNVNNPGGMKYTIYNRQGKFSLAQGDMATSAPDFVKESVQFDEKRDAGKSATGYDIYHKTYSGAMQHAYAHAKKKHGVTVSSDDIDSKVASGPSKPSSGKTVSHVLGTDKKKKLHVQVYNTGKSYELNMYVESVEEASILKTVHKNVTNKKSAEKDRKKAVKTVKDIRKGKYAGVKMANEDDDPCWDTHKKVGTKMKGGKRVNDCVPKNEGKKPVSQMTPAEKAADAKRRKEYIAFQKSKRNESTELDEAIDFRKAFMDIQSYAKKSGGMDKTDFEKVAYYVKAIGDNQNTPNVANKAFMAMKKHIAGLDTDVRDGIHVLLKKHGMVKNGRMVQESVEKKTFWDFR
jgi:hypothetical protein